MPFMVSKGAGVMPGLELSVVGFGVLFTGRVEVAPLMRMTDGADRGIESVVPEMVSTPPGVRVWAGEVKM